MSVSISTSVDFPAPDSPTNATVVLAGMVSAYVLQHVAVLLVVGKADLLHFNLVAQLRHRMGARHLLVVLYRIKLVVTISTAPIAFIVLLEPACTARTDCMPR